MKRAPTGNEPKRPSRASVELSSSPRLAAAGSQAIEAHTRVRWLAERVGKELDDAAPPDGAPPEDLDPSDSVVVAVEKATTTMKSVTASMAAVSGTSSPSLALPSTKLGIGAPDGKPPVVRTKLGIGTGSRHKSKSDTESDE